MVKVHRDTFSNKFVNLLPLETFHVRIHVVIQSCDTPFAVLFDLILQVSLGGRHWLFVNDCPCLFVPRVLDRLFGENIAGVANGRFAVARKRAMIRHVAIPRRLDNLNGRLVHIVFEVMSIGIKVDTTEVVD